MYYPVVGFENGFAGELIVAVSDSHGANGGIYTSRTGLTGSWTERFSYPTSGAWGQLAFGGPANAPYYLIVSNDGTQVDPGFPAISYDGETWPQGDPLPTVNGGQIWSFPLWVPSLQKWLMINKASENWIAESSDGLNWAIVGNRSDSGLGAVLGFTYFNGAIVVSFASGIRYSLDHAVTWATASGLTTGYNQVFASLNLNKLVAVGSTATAGLKIALTSDPASWTESALPFDIFGVNDDKQNTSRIYVGSSSTLLYTGTSTDGTNWTQDVYGSGIAMLGPLLTLNNTWFGWTYATAGQSFVSNALTGPYSAQVQPNVNFNRVTVARAL